MSQSSGRRTFVPTAHYPPSIVGGSSEGTSSSAANNIRSALSASPHFGPPSTNVTSAKSSGTSRRDAAPLSTTTSRSDHQLDASAHRNPKLLKQLQQQQAPFTAAPSKVLSCPSHPDVYACINCTFDDGSGSIDAPTTFKTRMATSSRNRLGPALLELRRLHLHGNQDDDYNSSLKLFSSSPLAMSQGNPSQGTTVVSTCMAYPTSIDTTSPSSSNYAPCATGLSTGALCIHSFSGNDDDGTVSSIVTRFNPPKHQRQASAVAWRPNHGNSHVAIGFVASSIGAAAGAAVGGSGSAISASSSSSSLVVGGHHYRQHPLRDRGGGSGGRTALASGGDRDFCCLLWDVNQAGTTSEPVSKLSRNIGVASLAWLANGTTLIVGSQVGHMHHYDLRIAGTPVCTSKPAHTDAVEGIAVMANSDPYHTSAHGRNDHEFTFATFGKTAGEPVKLWDTRRMEKSVGDIKVPSGRIVSAIQWSPLYPGTLSVAVGDTVQHYDTTASRPVLIRQSHAESSILDLALCFPAKTISTSKTDSSDEERANQDILSNLCQNRMLAVLADRSVHDMPDDTSAPLAISRRDGRVAHAFGGSLWIESPAAGPSAMENPVWQRDEDVSARMMRLAKCTRATRYSMDAASNIQMWLEEEEEEQNSGQQKDTHSTLPSTQMLLRLWSWIHLIERLCGKRETYGADRRWPAEGLSDSGVWYLLHMNASHNASSSHAADKDTVNVDGTLAITAFDSPSRRVAMSACGWAGSETLADIQSECESSEDYERSAALAVWHGDIGAAVEALQRGANALKTQKKDEKAPNDNNSPPLAETLQLVSMCIAGYRGADPTSSYNTVWRKACLDLLQRDDLSRHNANNARVAYLRSVCTFLVRIGVGDELKSVLDDEQLSVGDRVAFACRFLDHGELRTYLERLVSSCQESGNLEGLIITGVEKDGLKILQAYVDKYADVQTAALVCSRVTFAGEPERQWSDAYRALLNTWQMWQSRAMFDVDVAEYQRKLKERQDAESHGGRIMNYQARRIVHPSIPAQLDARCNKCSKPLTGLRGRQDGAAPKRLAKANPKTVLSCCPHCLSPLPRCSICLLSLGCLNPYMKKERANLPIAEWFTWCMRCKHGGHAHHLVGWFAQHETCPVSGCDCRCQFDAMQKIHRCRAVSNVNLDNADDMVEVEEEGKE